MLEISSLLGNPHWQDLSDCAKFLTPKLFDDRGNRISTRVLSKAQKPGVYRIDFDKLALFNGLHPPSTFEIGRVVARLAEVEGCSINQKDSMGDTPLAWAAGSGHEAVVELLLGRADIDPDKPGLGGQTPLMLAACGGREGVVKMLLGRNDVNPNKQDEGGETPLGWAAYNGHEGVVKILLGRDDVNPNKPGEVGVTPLGWAAYNGHQGVVKMLLRRNGFGPDKPDEVGQIPLYYTAETGHWEMVEIPRRDDVNPNMPGKGG